VGSSALLSTAESQSSNICSATQNFLLFVPTHKNGEENINLLVKQIIPSPRQQRQNLIGKNQAHKIGFENQEFNIGAFSSRSSTIIASDYASRDPQGEMLRSVSYLY